MKRITLILALLVSGFGMSVMGQDEINTQQFKQLVWNYDSYPDKIVLKSKVPVIIDFFATWCRPCKMLAPELTKLQNTYKGKIKIYKVDIDKSPELANMFGVQSIPTVFFLNTNGNYNYFLGYRTFDEINQFTKETFFKK